MDTEGRPVLSAADVMDQVTLGRDPGPDARERLRAWCGLSEALVSGLVSLRASMGGSGDYLSRLVDEAQQAMTELSERLSYTRQRLDTDR
ncbi:MULTISPECIES: hypothetical protein [Actinocatenispora]|uniref:Uncharacterized protein n=1 Tax=Actinocatenispora comari TaxID=2807577 RepID=A0A8J4EM27_9ACTN|nr:hypothetical protein [Actinocatenispora comari]GIL29917.1 hypothetical protein NUM_51710 [Actinocatenispora comari]